MKLTDQVLMVVERVIEKIRDCIVIDMLFVFMPERGATGAIFITRLLQVKFLDINNNLCFALIDLEKAFNRVPLEVLWWVVHVIDVPEWTVIVQAMYNGVKGKVRVNSSYSDEFEVKVDVQKAQQG